MADGYDEAVRLAVEVSQVGVQADVTAYLFEEGCSLRPLTIFRVSTATEDNVLGEAISRLGG